MPSRGHDGLWEAFVYRSSINPQTNYSAKGVVDGERPLRIPRTIRNLPFESQLHCPDFPGYVTESNRRFLISGINKTGGQYH
jgi:hypothetical protein